MRSASTSRVTVVRSVSNSRPKEEDDFFPAPPRKSTKITPGKKRPPPGLAEQPSYRWGVLPVSRAKSTSRGRAGSSRGRATATPPPERNTSTQQQQQAPSGTSPRSSSRRQQRKQSLDLSPLQMTVSSTQKSKTNIRTPSTGASTANSSSSAAGGPMTQSSASSEQRIQQA
eukprot:scaffold339683_cov31-Attheya_sp.AAC.1